MPDQPQFFSATCQVAEPTLKLRWLVVSKLPFAYCGLAFTFKLPRSITSPRISNPSVFAVLRIFAR
jgi:hypothetical protein